MSRIFGGAIGGPYHRRSGRGGKGFRPGSMRTYVPLMTSSSVSCFPAFSSRSLLAIVAELLQSPTALAPEPGGTQQVGEVSLAAEAFGIHPGMRLGEALARCPRLTLVPPDPAGVADFWERLLVRLESVGAEVEPERPGLVCFDAHGLLRLCGGLEGVLACGASRLAGPCAVRSGPLEVFSRRGGYTCACAKAGDCLRWTKAGTRVSLPRSLWRCCEPGPRSPIFQRR